MIPADFYAGLPPRMSISSQATILTSFTPAAGLAYNIALWQGAF